MHLSHELSEHAKLEVMTVKRRTLAPVLTLDGSVTFAANEVAQVGARVPDDHLWVEINLFEHELALVDKGDDVEIASEAHPGERLHGEVSYVDATIDPATRTAKVRVSVDNRERLLRPGQFVTARLETAANEQAAILVPMSAVLNVEGDPSVFVVLGDGSYFAREVELGRIFDETVEVKRGLLDGEKIVSQGGFALKSELMR